MPRQALVGQQLFLGAIELAEFPFIGDQVVNTIVAKPADHQAALPHLLDSITFTEPVPPMDFPRDQVMKRQRLIAPAKFAARFRLAFASKFGGWSTHAGNLPDHAGKLAEVAADQLRQLVREPAPGHDRVAPREPGVLQSLNIDMRAECHERNPRRGLT